MDLTLASDSRVVLADLGGTNCRLAVWSRTMPPREFAAATRVRNDDYADLAALLSAYLDRVPGERPRESVIAVAAPVTSDDITMPNRDWRFNRIELAAATGLERIDFINDFEAQALAIPALSAAERKTLGPDRTPQGTNAAVLGPGTGLGVAGLVATATPPIAITGEGGNVTMAASNDTEAALISAARQRFGHCSAERLISGQGLECLHELLHDGVKASAESISTSALAGDAKARATFDQFFEFLGAFAGDVALTFGATRGVYIGGGVALENAPLLVRSKFRDRFTAKGKYADYLDAIPTYLITADTPALFGLAQYVSNHEELPA